MNAREMIEAVLSRVGGDATSFPRRVIAKRINSLVKEFCKYFPEQFQATDTGTLLTGSTTLAIPAACREIISFQVGDYKWSAIRVEDKNRTKSTDKVYWVVGGTDIAWRYELDSGTTYELTYMENPTDIAADTDSIQFPEEVHEFVVTIVASRLSPKMVDATERNMAYTGLRNYVGIQPVQKRIYARSKRNGYIG